MISNVRIEVITFDLPIANFSLWMLLSKYIINIPEVTKVVAVQVESHISNPVLWVKKRGMGGVTEHIC